MSDVISSRMDFLFSGSRFWVIVGSLAWAAVVMGCAAPESTLQAQRSTSVPPGFERYQIFSAMDFTDFRAFAMNTETGRWGYTVHSNSPKKAMDRAINRCERTGQKCRLYALGDTIVEGMSPEQIAEIGQDYYVAISPLMANADLTRLVGERLSSVEILAHLSNVAVEVVTFNNMTYLGQWHSNGTMSATSTYQKGSENATADSGTWSVSGDKLCRQWKQWLGGRHECFVVTKDGSTLRAYDIHGDIIEMIDVVEKIQGSQPES